jgi:hypothetical protein
LFQGLVAVLGGRFSMGCSWWAWPDSRCYGLDWRRFVAWGSSVVVGVSLWRLCCIFLVLLYRSHCDIVDMGRVRILYIVTWGHRRYQCGFWRPFIPSPQYTHWAPPLFAWEVMRARHTRRMVRSTTGVAEDQVVRLLTDKAEIVMLTSRFCGTSSVSLSPVR